MKRPSFTHTVRGRLLLVFYIVVSDKTGKQIAPGGWTKGAELPLQSTSFSLFSGG